MPSGGDTSQCSISPTPDPQKSDSNGKHRHHRSKRRSAKAPVPPPPVDDIEELVAPDDWAQDSFRQPNPSASGLVILPRKILTKKSNIGTKASTSSKASEPTEEAPTTDGTSTGHKASQEADTVMTAGDGQASVPLPHSSSTSPELGVPGTQRLWVATFGCSHNVSDSEYMEGMLSSYGYTLVPEPERDTAALWLLNSCTVKNPSQQGVTNLIAKAQAQGKAVVVAGCVPQGDRNLAALEGCSLVGIAQIERVVEVVEQSLAGHVVRLLSKATLPRLDLPKVRKNPSVEIIPLSTGCLGACTYCKTRHARGKLGSYALEAIWERASQVLEEGEGVTEIWLSSEDTGAYGRDLEGAGGKESTMLPRLLTGLTDMLPPDVMLRVGMTNPPFILDQLESIATCLRHPNVFEFLHVPVQSGSNRVLTAMNREYTVEEFCMVVDTLRRLVPGMTVATDIICGFPGETEEDFQETLALVDKYKFAICNISQFYPRPGTPAAKMPKVPSQQVKDRSRRLTRLFESFNPYAGMEDTSGPVTVWFNRERSADGQHAVGHTKAYVKVLVPWEEGREGVVGQVKIVGVARWHVWGEMLSWKKIREPRRREGETKSGEVVVRERKGGYPTRGRKERRERRGEGAGVSVAGKARPATRVEGAKAGTAAWWWRWFPRLYPGVGSGNQTYGTEGSYTHRDSQQGNAVVEGNRGSEGEIVVKRESAERRKYSGGINNQIDQAAAILPASVPSSSTEKATVATATSSEPPLGHEGAQGGEAMTAVRLSVASSRLPDKDRPEGDPSFSASASSSSSSTSSSIVAAATSSSLPSLFPHASHPTDGACLPSSLPVPHRRSGDISPAAVSTAQGGSEGGVRRREQAGHSSAVPRPHPHARQPSQASGKRSNVPEESGKAEVSGESLSANTSSTLSGGSTSFFSHFFLGGSSARLAPVSSMLWLTAKTEVTSVSFWALLALLCLISSWLAQLNGVLD